MRPFLHLWGCCVKSGEKANFGEKRLHVYKSASVKTTVAAFVSVEQRLLYISFVLAPCVRARRFSQQLRGVYSTDNALCNSSSACLRNCLSTLPGTN